MRYEFEKVSIYAKKSGKCRCGKRRTRSEHLWMTVNPFNKNARGEVKTRQEVRADLAKRHEEWIKEQITCSECPPRTQEGN